MKKKRITIGTMTRSRGVWQMAPYTRIKPNKKGKGSYQRTRMKRIFF